MGKTQKSNRSSVHRPGTGARGFSLFTLALLVVSVPVFVSLKSFMPLSVVPDRGVAQAAAEFSLVDTQGSPHSLKVHKGKGLFLYLFKPDFPSTASDLEKIDAAYRGNALRRATHAMIGICLGCTKKAAQNVAAAGRLTVPICADQDYSVSSAFGVSAVPYSFVIAPWGTIKHEHLGPIRDMEQTFSSPFEKHLGIRLDVWRYQHGTPEERRRFLETLPVEFRKNYYEQSDPKLVRFARRIACPCDRAASLEGCGCNPKFKDAMYRWINYLVLDGSFSAEQIDQMARWKADGLVARKIAAEGGSLGSSGP